MTPSEADDTGAGSGPAADGGAGSGAAAGATREARAGSAVAVKAQVRSRVLARRAALDPAVRLGGDVARDRVLADLLAGARVAAYASFGTEPSTLGLLAPGYLLPVVRADRDLDWVAYDGRLPVLGTRLGPGAVARCDVVLVPALAVDRTGVRLGRGGGSYDRALRRATGLLVALLHEGELVDSLPAEPHDVPVHAVATPSGLLRL